MNRTYLISVLLSAAIAAIAQTPPAAKPAASKSAKVWRQTKTPDGQPDLQGVWVNFDSTPFERAAPASATAPASGNQNALLFTDRAPKVAARPSMVVEPANGRVPLTPWAEQQRDYSLSHVQDS